VYTKTFYLDASILVVNCVMYSTYSVLLSRNRPNENRAVRYIHCPNTVLLLTNNGELILIQFNKIVGTVKEWKIK
jgi:hypothetical protein